MDFIKLHNNFISENTCLDLINYYKSNSEILSERKKYSLNSAVKDIELSNLNDPYWDEVESTVVLKAEDLLKDYLGKSDCSEYVYGSMVIMHCSEFFSIPYHYDLEVDVKDDSDALRRFALLIYLNGDFEGGELMFPVQEKVIKPAPGLAVIFPTSFMYPHLTTPPFGNDRYVLRLSYHLK